MRWMAWTLPTALFFVSIGLSLLAMTIFEIKRPTTMARGFLPMPTSRGDRFFISLLSAAFIHMFWLATMDGSLLIASGFSALWALLLMRWG